MCGIAGIIGPNAKALLPAVRKMVAALAHRGPDGEGFYVSQSGACVLGHRRLSILDPSTAASQPMTTTDSRFALTYNGELYNFRELRERLARDESERFSSTGDTEVLLKLLARRGTEALRSLNGMYAFALWDEANRKALLVRDRFGQKPLYLARVGQELLFSSELRALLASELIPRSIDLSAMTGYLSFGAVPGTNTIVKGVSLLPRSTYLEVEANGAEKLGTYWSFTFGNEPSSTEDLSERFRLAVERHLISDVPVALFLSGGLDSSAIAACASKSRSGAQTAICVTFPDEPRISEGLHASRVAKHCGMKYQEIPVVRQEAIGWALAAVDSMDQPTHDGVNTYIVSRAAGRAGFKVALSGVGGDELFGGYSSFKDVPRMGGIRRIIAPFSFALSVANKWSGQFTKKSAKLLDLLDSSGDILSSYLVRRRLFSSRQLHSLLPSIPNGQWIYGLSPARRGILEGQLLGLEPINAVSLLELDLYMGEMLLRDSDAMGMSQSLEIRLPFLDSDLVEWVLSRNSNVRAPFPTPKHSLLESMKSQIPLENTQRSKQGFELPFESWLLRDLKGAVIDGINSLADRVPAISANLVSQLWDEFERHPDKVGWTRPWSLFVLSRYVSNNRLTL